MKCPSCKEYLSNKDRFLEDGRRERYKCQSCEMISIPKHGSLFIVIMPLVVWPVIHVLLSLSLGALLYWLLGDMEIGGWELSEIIIFVLSALVALIVMIKVNVLEPLRKG